MKDLLISFPSISIRLWKVSTSCWESSLSYLPHKWTERHSCIKSRKFSTQHRSTERSQHWTTTSWSVLSAVTSLGRWSLILWKRCRLHQSSLEFPRFPKKSVRNSWSSSTNLMFYRAPPVYISTSTNLWKLLDRLSNRRALAMSLS